MQKDNVDTKTENESVESKDKIIDEKKIREKDERRKALEQKQKMMLEFNKLSIPNIFNTIRKNVDTAIYGTADTFSMDFPSSETIIIETLIDMGHKYSTKLHEQFKSYIYGNYDGAIENITTPLVIIKDNPGINNTKIHYMGSKVRGNLKDVGNIMVEDGITLFDWKYLTNDLDQQYRITLNIYCLIVATIDKCLIGRDIIKTDVYNKVGSFREFINTFPSHRLSYNKELGIFKEIIRKKTEKTNNVTLQSFTHNIPLSNSENDQVEGVVDTDDDKTIFDTKKLESINDTMNNINN